MKKILMIFVALAAFVATASAQEVKDSIALSGRVTDSLSGKGLPFAKINVRQGCYVYWTTVTDTNGYCTVTIHPYYWGYDLECCRLGYECYWKHFDAMNDIKNYAVRMKRKEIKPYDPYINAPSQQMEREGVKVSVR